MLIEVMIVLCLLMLLIGLALGNMAYLNGMRGYCAVHTLSNMCSYLQMRARATNQTQILTFDVEHNSYSYNGTKEQLPEGVIFGVLDGAKGPPSSPVHPITYPITSQNQCITFTPYGIMQPGTVYIKTVDNSRMYALSVAVAQVSFLRMYEYQNGIWKIICYTSSDSANVSSLTKLASVGIDS